LEIILSSSN
jgi:hypothetical protein